MKEKVPGALFPGRKQVIHALSLVFGITAI